jgi:phage FluMu protein gp41
MLTEKGTLPVGLEHNGITHKDFEIREQLVRDSVTVFDDPFRAKRAEKNDSFMGLCILAGQLLTLGSIPKEEITPELLLDMTQSDINELSAAARRLEERRKSFRSETKEPLPQNSRPAEAGR